MKQKFRTFSFVTFKYWGGVSEGIIGGSYLQLYGANTEDSYKKYTMYVVNKGKIINRVAWINEDDITLKHYQDRDQAEQMIEQYCLNK